LFKRIIDVKYDFDDPAWDDVSEAPKEIIRKLLVKDPAQRLTASQLAEHPWVKGISVTERHLTNAGTNMNKNKSHLN
jgi:serine/threonine protein kinase